LDQKELFLPEADGGVGIIKTKIFPQLELAPGPEPPGLEQEEKQEWDQEPATLEPPMALGSQRHVSVGSAESTSQM